MGKKSKKEGNKFQKDFEESVPGNLYCDRYKDSPIRFKAVTNPADYFLNSGFYTLLVECKTTDDTNLPLKNIRMDQIWKMLCITCKLNTFGGLLINFRKYDATYFVFVSDFVHWYLNRTSESVPLYWIKSHGYKLSQKQRVTRWRYGVQGLLNWIMEVKFDVSGV
jgi:penicillin-binding protein-related factor A (putative recombinase)